MRELFHGLVKLAVALALTVTVTTASRPAPASAASPGPNCSYVIWPQKDIYGRYLWAHAQWSTSTSACRSWTGKLYLDMQITSSGGYGYVQERYQCIGINTCTTADFGSANTVYCMPTSSDAVCDYFPSLTRYSFTGYVRARLIVDSTAGPGTGPFTYYYGTWRLWPGSVPVQ